MIELFKFQTAASRDIARRFIDYKTKRLMKDEVTPLPFIQMLSALTGSGKTPILANSLELISAGLPTPPVVLWVSKGKVVVSQTLHNLSGGKYASLVGNYTVKPLQDFDKRDIEDSSKGLLLVATVGKFNQKDKESGDRRIFQTGLDSASQSLWDQLRERFDSAGVRRSLVVIYDEGHNLSDQQTRLINELAPDALIAASATAKYPQELTNDIARLRRERNWADADFQVMVKSSEVVEAGLIKQFVKFDGFTTPMEEAIDEMMADFSKASASADTLGAGFRPKAIYVSNTNVLDKQSDDPLQPFSDRQARPIRIWRHLVEQHGINPNEIAVYLNLKFDKKYPAPENFHLFANGEDDYQEFTQGDYRHVIFNLSLQEGWDDPECGFAYIDKDMGSPTQVAQVIGRVLRQPGARHYADPNLNTAHFYIRTDETGTFEEVLTEVRKKIAKDAPDIEIIVSSASTSKGMKLLESVKKVKHVPVSGINTVDAKIAIDALMTKLPDYRQDSVNTVGTGSKTRVLQKVGQESDAEVQWVEVTHSNPVTARWVFMRELEHVEPRASRLCNLSDPRLDAKVEYNSRAADQLRRLAEDIAKAYIQRSEIKVKSNDDPYEISEIAVTPEDAEPYKYALHARYSGLNNLEKKFASALERKKTTWARNPTSGYSLPLLSEKGRKFSPDFFVWIGKDVVAIDTKGDHLIENEADRKLLLLQNDGKGPSLHIRLVTEGEWDSSFRKKPGSKGMTVWMPKHGTAWPVHCQTAEEAVALCMSP
ncbi:DEAD/DEAH box helicase family protein [Deinococcus xianganensis]|uniref:DEAD/DEAH box helicase family protein n=1 Tax=Deinococcus xianganensis TaxID=1507289 RepID=A0A6I4YHJ5_9DEIO|nr:DEAD/DEAH box helicase family protein [Deinococcus xianganensis]MXV21849.1 DEAD/DEAH box helicase family protein [Deinococcus xianganensis]